MRRFEHQLTDKNCPDAGVAVAQTYWELCCHTDLNEDH